VTAVVYHVRHSPLCEVYLIQVYDVSGVCFTSVFRQQSVMLMMIAYLINTHMHMAVRI
jgi:hypothetical protein